VTTPDGSETAGKISAMTATESDRLKRPRVDRTADIRAALTCPIPVGGTAWRRDLAGRSRIRGSLCALETDDCNSFGPALISGAMGAIGGVAGVDRQPDRWPAHGVGPITAASVAPALSRHEAGAKIQVSW
jgi:hypothetical protein